jgi:hypothetical protein
VVQRQLRDPHRRQVLPAGCHRCRGLRGLGAGHERKLNGGVLGLAHPKLLRHARVRQLHPVRHLHALGRAPREPVRGHHRGRHHG